MYLLNLAYAAVSYAILYINMYLYPCRSPQPSMKSINNILILSLQNTFMCIVYLPTTFVSNNVKVEQVCVCMCAYEFVMLTHLIDLIMHMQAPMFTCVYSSDQFCRKQQRFEQQLVYFLGIKIGLLLGDIRNLVL